MTTRLVGASLAGSVIALVSISYSPAHEIVGSRFFPATLTIVPPIKQRDVSGEFSKRITEDFGGYTYDRRQLYLPGRSVELNGKALVK